MRHPDFLKLVNKKIILQMGISAFILILIIVGLLVIRDYKQDQSHLAMEERKMAYNTDRLNRTTQIKNRSQLLYPEVIEELDLSMDLYRSKNFIWTEQELSRLWIKPDASDIDFFTEANHKLVWDILKDVP